MARKLFDCFLFFNELDMLEVRLRETGAAVDHFILVESTLTFQGKRKPLVFAANKERFARWSDRIIHVVVDDDDIENNPRQAEWWRRETYQRNQIARGLDGAAPDDLVMVSDVDEIVRGGVLRKIKADLVPGAGCVVSQRMYYGQFNRRDLSQNWQGPRVVEKRRFVSGQISRRLKAQPDKVMAALGLGSLGVRLRNLHMCGCFIDMIDIPDGGWHFSSIGTYETWRAKVEAFSHPECKERPSYQSAEGYRQWVEGLTIEPLEAMPPAVRDEPRLKPFVAQPAPVG